MPTRHIYGLAQVQAVTERTDAYVAWIGDGPSAGLHEALTTWFGPPDTETRPCWILRFKLGVVHWRRRLPAPDRQTEPPRGPAMRR